MATPTFEVTVVLVHRSCSSCGTVWYAQSYSRLANMGRCPDCEEKLHKSIERDEENLALLRTVAALRGQITKLKKVLLKQVVERGHIYADVLPRKVKR